MKVNKLIIMLILVIFLFSLTSVCAGKMDDTIASDDTNQIELSSNDKVAEDNLQTSEEKLNLGESDDSAKSNVSLKSSDGDELSSSGEFGELQKLIDDASHNSTINLERNYTYTIGADTITEGIRIIKNLTINGNGFTINAQGKSRILNIESGTNVVLNNITFTNGFADSNGGAILAYGNVDITGSRFINNTANQSGGAVYVDGAYSDSKINSTFINNHAFNGGAIYFKNGITNVSIDGVYKDNIALRGGGAIFVRGKSMNNNFTAEFAGNKARNASGGAIFIYNQADNNRFEGIYMDNWALYGGGIFFYNKANNNVFNTEFINNTAKSCGGAMFFHNTTDGNNFTGDFTNNRALGQVNSENGNGGAITFKDTSSNSIFNSDFINNTASLNGGGVNYRHTPYNITFNSNFINNTSPRGGGVNFFETFENVVFNGEFISNSADNGGAIATVDGIIRDVSFKDNHAEGEGGAVYFKGFGEIINCNFTNNTADYGGAVYIFGTGEVRDCVFINNTGFVFAGALMMRYGTVSDSSFTGNTAHIGGAVRINGEATVTRCNFTDNSASLEGGAVYLGSPGNVAFSNFIGNKATGDGVGGGAVLLYEGGNVSYSNFTNNHVSTDGGAVHFYDDGALSYCNFYDNEAGVTGGAVYFYNDGTVSNSNFIGNEANGEKSSGGAICFDEAGNVINSIFTANKATRTGGAIYFNSTGKVSNCIFTNNEAVADYDGGGAISMISGNVTNSIFTANRASGVGSMGGAVLIKNSGNVTNCKFKDNSAEFGGAVSSDRTVNIADCNFTANRASIEGGAFYIGSCNIENSNFTNNIASNGESSGDGGAVYITGNATVINCNFIGNEAYAGSAIYFWNLKGSKHVRSISHSIFLNNKANKDSIAPFTLTVNGTNIEIAFNGNNNLFNAILSRLKGDVNVTNVTYWGANGIENTGDSTIVPVVLYTQAGQNITVRGVIDGVEVNINKVTDAEGKIVLENVREYNITVSHDEDSYYTSAKTLFTSRQLSLNVTDITTNDLTVNITAESEILNDVMPGEVVFMVDGQYLYASYAGNGTWWAMHTFDDFGTYKVNASFSGPYNVTIHNATITIIKPMNPDDVNVSVVGDKVTVTVPSDVTGNVSIIINNVIYSVNIVKGTGSIQVPEIPSGTVTIVISNDIKYGNISYDVAPTVSAISLDNNKNINVFYLEPASYSVRILANGKPLSGIQVKFTVAGKTYYANTDSNGVATVKPALAPGKYTITASYADKSVSNSYTVKQIIQAKKTTNIKKSKKKTVIKITVKGHKVKQTANIKFTYKGKNKISVSFGKDMKKQTVTIKFNGKTYKVNVNAKGKGTLKLTKKAAKKLKKGKKYTAKITYNGPKLYKKVKLTIKFNGKKYNIKTDSNGVGKFKITKNMVKKLKKGKKINYAVTYKQTSLKRFVKIK